MDNPLFWPFPDAGATPTADWSAAERGGLRAALTGIFNVGGTTNSTSCEVQACVYSLDILIYILIHVTLRASYGGMD